LNVGEWFLLVRFIFCSSSFWSLLQKTPLRKLLPLSSRRGPPHFTPMWPQQVNALDRRLSEFLRDLLGPMGRGERRRWARVYVEGLLLDGEHKSIEPMAARIEGADAQPLRQFVGRSPWAVEEVQRRLALKVSDLLGHAQVRSGQLSYAV